MAFRIAICCCNYLFGEGIKALIKECGLDTPDNISDTKGIVKTKPDLLIADFNSLSRIFIDAPLGYNVSILLLEAECLPMIEDEQLLNFIKKGLVGILSSRANSSQFKKAIKTVISGELWFDRKKLKSIANDVLAEEKSLLTKRETEVIKLICQGYSNKEIMKKLYISGPTVKSHLNGVYKKLGIHDRLQLCIKAITTNQFKLHQMLQKRAKGHGIK